MNPARSEQDAFRFLLLVIGVALATAAAGILGDGSVAAATFLSLAVGIFVGMRISRRQSATGPDGALAARVPGLPVLLVAPSDLAGASLAREVAAEEGVRSVRAVLLADEDDAGAVASRRAAELRALLGEHGVSAQVISVARADAEKAVDAELRDGAMSHVFIATHRREHPSFVEEEKLVHAIDDSSTTPVVAVAFASG